MTDNSSLVNQVFRHALTNMFGVSGIVLDIGCGPGQYRESLGDGYIGLDLTSEPYKDGVSRGTDIVGDARWIPLAAGSLDAAFSVAAIHQVPGPGNAISEVFRALKPGGKFLLFDYNWRTLNRLRKKGDGRGISGNRVLHTQWGWKRELESSGFAETRLWLEPEFEGRRYGRLERWVRLLRNEVRDGGWACVSGTKPLN